MQTIVELPEFQHRKAKLLSELESTRIINYLSAFESIKQGLEEAIEFSKSKKSIAIVHKFTLM